MSASSFPVIVLPGAAGGAPDLSVFRADSDDVTRFETIGYPGWRRYIEDGYSADTLIADLTAQIETIVPLGPIRIVGISIGGHFGYAVALRLQAGGREIGGLCAIDTFMVSSAAPSAGWKGRALTRGSKLLRKGRIGELTRFLRSLFWRALFRLAGSRLRVLLRKFTWLSWFLAIDPMFEKELSMRLLIREVAPWFALLDREPVELKAAATLLRTRFTADDDAAWRRRCARIKIVEIPGEHQTMFERENFVSLGEALVTATRDWRY